MLAGFVMHLAPRVRFLDGINRHTVPCRGRRGAGYCRQYQVGWSSEYTREAGIQDPKESQTTPPPLRLCSLGQRFLDARELDLAVLVASVVGVLGHRLEAEERRGMGNVHQCAASMRHERDNQIRCIE